MRICYSLLAVLFFLSFIGCKKETSVKNTNITIGGLLSLTGNWSSLGVASQEAMNLAITDINGYMVQTGSSYRFSVAIFDTKLDTSLAQAAIKEVLSKNIHSIVGPQSSAELGAISPFANTNKILVVSQGSTASSLAIGDDALFRFCPGDAVEGKALTQTIYHEGIHALITLARNDIGNKGLQNSVGLSFAGLGGTSDAIVPYTINMNDFTTILSTLKVKIQQLSQTNGASHVGVYLVSFDVAIKIKTGSDPDAYALSVYDAMWVIAKKEVPFPNASVDFSTLKSVFLAEADRYYGITGPLYSMLQVTGVWVRLIIGGLQLKMTYAYGN